MSDDEIRAMLTQLRQQSARLPMSYQSPEFGVAASGEMPESMPMELRMLQQPELRMRGSKETPVGQVGVSAGTEMGEPTARLEYMKQLQALGGLLGIGGYVGEKSKGASVSYEPSNLPLSVSASMSENQFGQVMRNLQAQYAQEIMKNLVLGIYGQAGSQPMVGARLQGRF
jgi:hypothetical protein